VKSGRAFLHVKHDSRRESHIATKMEKKGEGRLARDLADKWSPSASLIPQQFLEKKRRREESPKKGEREYIVSDKWAGEDRREGGEKPDTRPRES